MKFLVICMLLGYACATALVGSKRCTWGPTYWCSDLKTAKECGAMKHCIGTVWKYRQPPSKNLDDDQCSFCKFFTSEVRGMVREKKDQDAIVGYLKQACDLIPDATFKSQCNELVKDYTLEVLELIVSELDPATVCDVMGLCKQSYKSQLVHEMQKSKKLPKVIKLGNATDCADCTKFMTDVQTWLKNATTAAEVVKLLEDDVCQPLGSNLEALCDTVVEMYTPQIIEMLSSELDPATFCKNIGFCNATRLHVVRLLKLKRNSIMKKFIQLSGKLGDNTTCTDCKKFVGDLRMMVENNATEAQIENAIVTNLCDNLGPLASMCQQVVAEIVPEIMEFLAGELDPATVCADLGFCKSDHPSIAMTTIHKAASTIVHKPGRVVASAQCIICEWVMQKLDAELEKNSTQQQIKAALEKVCLMMPSTVGKDCTDFVDKYTAAIIDILAEGISPKFVCTALKLCQPGLHQQKVSVLAEPVSCETCKLLTGYVLSMFKENATQQVMEKELDKICTKLADVQTECKNMVKQYLPTFLRFLAQQSPAKICQELELCNSSSISKKDGVAMGQVHLWKKDDYKCIAGPSYWCASDENAKICNAVDHCKRHVWN